MRITSTVLTKVYPPWKYTTKEGEIRFKPQLGIPIKLRNKVVSHQNAQSGTKCLQEMYNMMACLKKNEFGESACSKEITLFQKCAKTTTPVNLMSSAAGQKAARKRSRSGTMNIDEMNAFLSKYPQHFEDN